MWAFVSICLVFLIVTVGVAFYGARQGVVEPTPFWVAELATLPPPQIDYFMPDFRLPTAPATGRDTAGSVVGIHPPGAGSVMATDLVQGNDENPGWGTAPTNTPSAQETVPPPPVETAAPTGRVAPIPTLPNDEDPGWSVAPTNTPSAQETIPAPPTATPPPQETVAPTGRASAGIGGPDGPGIGDAGGVAAMGTPSIGPAPTLPPPVETITPTVTPTSTPEPTPTIVPTPDPSRFCTDDEHDTTRMHGRYLHDADGNPICTFDHSHKPPNEGYPSGLFLSYTGQQISYPWATANGAENYLWPDGKHEAYNWQQVDTSGWQCRSGDAGCIDSIEVEWHGMASNKGFATRFHSFAALLRIGDGYIFWAGHMDCGRIVTIQYADGSEVQVDIDPTGRPQPSGTALKHAQIGNGGQTWYCQLPDTPVENFIAQQYSVNLAPITEESLGYGLETVCTDTDPACVERDQSKKVLELIFDISSPWTNYLDPDGNGWIEHYAVFVDRYGNVNTDCPAEVNAANASADCVPFAIHNVPRARYHIGTNDAVRFTRPDAWNNIWWAR